MRQTTGKNRELKGNQRTKRGGGEADTWKIVLILGNAKSVAKGSITKNALP